MSLSKKIIFGTDKDVANELKAGPKLDELDEYGYTPLTQAAIVNSVTKAKLLLDAGAKIDFTDLTGRTPLFWAADNANLNLCKLLLNHQANPNAYTSGGQPVLVMPLLKKQDDIKKLLLSFGGHLDFAQDFINAKELGHAFELEGRVDIVDTNNTFIEVEFEGFFLRFTLEIIANSLFDFKNNFKAKKLRGYFAKLDKILHSLSVAIDLIKLQHYLIDIKGYLDYINTALNADPLILPISFGGHAITLLKYGDWFIRCDRGAYGRDHGTVIYYTLREQSRLTKSICRELLYKRQDPIFINEGLPKYLNLETKMTLPLPTQVTGNCSWANAEALIPALMFLFLYEERPEDLEACQNEALFFYYYWREWNKSRALDFCIQTLREANPARKAAKGALIASILYQTCNFNSKEGRERSNKILTILNQPELRPILQCYVKVFGEYKDNPYWQNFYKLLDDFGIDIDKLKAK
ncbi:MAG: ankyrin repeat domain-containing protein [Gammaproteobacteria bacterium]|nr:ankyrin repeat domain-containing protein [Gammaproteobacteria bacterium]